MNRKASKSRAKVDQIDPDTFVITLFSFPLLIKYSAPKEHAIMPKIILIELSDKKL